MGESLEDVMFNDILGTSLGVVKDGGYSAIDKTSFGADSTDKTSFFTGKPYVEDLGYAFLFRNYRADLGKWQMRDLIGYPDGWNNLAYCNNVIIDTIDILGCKVFNFTPFRYSKFEDSSNYNIVIAHGWDPIGFPEYKGMPIDKRNYSIIEIGEPMDAKTLMSEIKKMGGYDPNLPILLVTCYAGLNFADQLVKESGNKVLAADGFVWVAYVKGTHKIKEIKDFKLHE